MWKSDGGKSTIPFTKDLIHVQKYYFLHRNSINLNVI